MSGKSVFDAVTSVALDENRNMPCAHMAYPIGSAPPLPMCVYYLDEMDGYAADNKLHAKRNNWIVEHYWKVHDENIENALENAIESRFGAFKKTEVWVADENCVQTSYYFAEIERAEDSEDFGSE